MSLPNEISKMWASSMSPKNSNSPIKGNRDLRSALVVQRISRNREVTEKPNNRPVVVQKNGKESVIEKIPLMKAAFFPGFFHHLSLFFFVHYQILKFYSCCHFQKKNLEQGGWRDQVLMIPKSLCFLHFQEPRSLSLKLLASSTDISMKKQWRRKKTKKIASK